MENDQIPFKLFKQPKSKNYFIRFTVGEKEIRKSLGTDDHDEAMSKGYDVYASSKVRIELGLTHKNPTIDDLIPKFYEYLDSKVTRKNLTALRAVQHKRAVGFYLSMFCGKKPVSYLSKVTLEEFFDWRMTFWIDGPGKHITTETVNREGRVFERKINKKTKVIPSASTQQMEQSGLRIFMDWLADYKYIKNRINFKTARTEHNARPAFNQEEYKRFDGYMVDKVLSLKEGTEHRTKFKWRIFSAFCDFMIASGLRPTEARILKWKNLIGFDVRNYNTNDFMKLSIQVTGKGKFRIAIPLPEVMFALDALVYAHIEYFNSYPDKEDYIFCNTRKTISEDFDKYMNYVLAETGLITDYRGNKRTTYSFRHTYITNQLINGIDIYFLARNAGTSVDMIRKHYDHSTIEQHRMSLLPDIYKKILNLNSGDH
ncbi:site-specific integrase [Acetobacter persici]|uniref:tyrosine-type recombinase/integrase n=1 Tax=Acetobacter persici TaxID=1076596 RepID=UPI001BA9E427|nr:site-specific integrase [Acetobacter persici]MBS1016869.1 site-specific integrase [Acetobacter persici]MCP9320341.1 site-specific integrase [Acetobacter persici]